MSQRRIAFLPPRTQALRCALLLAPTAIACANAGHVPVRYAQTAPGAEPYPAVTEVPVEAVVAPPVVIAVPPTESPKATEMLDSAVQQHTSPATPIVTRSTTPLSHVGSEEASVRFVGEKTCIIEFAGATTLFHPTGLSDLVKAAAPQKKAAAGKKPAVAAPLSLGTETVDFVAIGHHGEAGINKAIATALWRQYHPVFIVPADGIGKTQLLRYGIPKTKVRELRAYVDAPTGKGHLSAAMVPGPEAAAKGKQAKHRAVNAGPAGYVLSDGHRRVYFAGEARYGSHFEQVHNRYGAPDISVLNIAAGKDAPHARTTPMSADEAHKAQVLLNSPVAITLPQLASVPAAAPEQPAANTCLVTPHGEEVLLVALGHVGPCELPAAKAASAIPGTSPATEAPAPAATPPPASSTVPANPGAPPKAP